MRYGNDAYFIETDKRGFRNTLKVDPSLKSIILLGDSFTAGDGVENSKRFSDILSHRLNCNVINLAVSGFGVDQQLLTYEKYKNEINHDYVILAPHLDDLKRNLLSSRLGLNKFTGKKSRVNKPFFTVINNQLKIQNTPVPRPIDEDINDTETIEDLTFFNRSKLFFTRRILKKKLHPEFENSESEEWLVMDKILDRFKEISGDKVCIVVPFPFYDSVTYKETPDFLKEFKKHENKNFHVLDVVSELNIKHEIKNDQIFLPLCGHFTEFAHKIIADKIISSNFLNIPFREHDSLSKDQPKTDTWVLGLSCLYHDSAAALIKNGVIVAAAQEERFTRIKHDKSFPINAINYCLEEGKIKIDELQSIVYYDTETWTIERVLHNSIAIHEKGEDFWNRAKSSLITKLKLPNLIRSQLNFKGDIFKTQHHISHAAGAFFPSPFEEAAILVIDGVGEWACTTIASGNNTSLTIHNQQYYPHSLGLLYSAITAFCGFKVNSGEYKLMGLAPYGKPLYSDLIKTHLVDINDDGSIFLNLDYFSFLEGEKMTNDKLADLFGGPERARESEISKREMDIAASIQEVTEEIVTKMAIHAYNVTGKKNLVMSGGVALNCVSNGKLFDNTPFDDIYFQPASGDAGGAIGCALTWYYEHIKINSKISQPDSYLGPSFSNDEVNAYLNTKGVNFHKFEENRRGEEIAKLLADNNIIGHFDGRMEFGPRALGNRSIIANPMEVEMQSKLNLKIKFRESFRPFAPIYAEERTQDYFDFDKPSPYMLIVRKLKQNLLLTPEAGSAENTNMIEIINQKRSLIPAITHVDNSARLQSVNSDQNKRFHDILMEFEKITGKAILINTSFNVRGEPIVCDLHDAYTCFMRTNMDVLVLNDFYLLKTEQPNWEEHDNWQDTFELD